MSEKERREKLLQGAEDYFHQEGEPDPGADNFGAFISLTAERGNFKYLNECFQRITHQPKGCNYGLFLLISSLNIYYKYLHILEPASIQHFKNILYDACLPQKFIYVVDFIFRNTNHPLCGTTIEILGGEILNNERMISSGLNKLRYYSRKLSGIYPGMCGYCGTISEFNSPTYAAVQLEPMAVLWKHSRIPEASALGALFQEFIFMDILSHWHPPTQQFSAPHSRSYLDNTIGGNGLSKYVLQAVLPEGVFYDMETAWSVDHQCDNAKAADIAATQFNCPDYLIYLARKKSYPYWVQMRTASHPDHEGIHFIPEGPVNTACYLENRYSLGSSSRPLGAGTPTDSPAVKWQKNSPVKSMKDHKVSFLRYVLDEALPFQDNPQKWGPPLTFPPSKMELVDWGIKNVLQHKNIALTLYRPKYGLRQAKSMKLAIFIPLYDEVDEVYLGERKVTSYPVVSKEPATVLIKDGPIAVGFRPLAVTNMGRDYAVSIDRKNQTLVISFYNYQGREHLFTVEEFLKVCNGVVILVNELSERITVESIRKRLNKALITDQISDSLVREVYYDDGKIKLSFSLSHEEIRLSEDISLTRKINDKDFQPVIFESPLIKTAQNGKVRIGKAVLEASGETPLRFLSIPEEKTYVVYNFYPEPADFILDTPYGRFQQDNFKRGKIVFCYQGGVWKTEFLSAFPPHSW